MQDRFKVRLWDITKHEFFDAYKINYDNDYDMVFTHGSKSIENTNVSLDNKHTKACVLEQCTGLKDKDGKLIYEGDIVNVSPLDSWNEKQTDEYSDVLGNRLVKEYLGAFILESDECNDSYFLGWATKNTNVKLVGNVHESPELLED